MNCCTPGFPVHHQWAESTQTHVHWVGDAIQPSHPLSSPSPPFSYFFKIYFILFFNFTMLYWFCHISTWIHHRYTRVPHPEPSSLLPPRTIPLGHPSATAPSIQYRASNLDWRPGWLIWRGTEGVYLLSDMLCVFACQAVIIVYNITLYHITRCFLSFFFFLLSLL